MQRTLRLALFALVVSLLHPLAFAGAPTKCDSVLFARDYSHIQERDTEFSSFLLSIDSSNYEEAKHSASASVPGYFDGDYSDFSKKKSRYLENQKTVRNRDQARDVLTSSTPASGIEAWRQCVLANTSGLYSFVSLATSKNVTVNVGWKRGVGVANLVIATIFVNGTQIQHSFPLGFEGDEGIPFVRADGSEISGVINANVVGGGSFTASFFVPALATTRTVSVPVAIGECIGRLGQEGVHLWGPLGESCNGLPPPGWGPYGTVGDSASTISSCVGRGGFKGVHLWGPTGNVCAGMSDWGFYSEETSSLESGELCSCMGHGDILEGHALWGPKGKTCAGIPLWGTYSMNCRAPSTKTVTVQN